MRAEVFNFFSPLLFYLKNRKGSTNERALQRPLTRTSRGGAYARIYTATILRRIPGDVDLTSHYTPLFPDCPDTKRRHRNPLHVLLPYPIPIGQSFALVLLSSSFFSFLLKRVILPKRISASELASFTFSHRPRSFLSFAYDPPNFQLSALFRGSGARRLSWFRTNCCRIESDKDKRGTDYVKR